MKDIQCTTKEIQKIKISPTKYEHASYFHESYQFSLFSPISLSSFKPRENLPEGENEKKSS